MLLLLLLILLLPPLFLSHYRKRCDHYQIRAFSSSTINLSNENSFDQQIAALGNKSYVVWADETTGNGDIYFKRSTDGGATFSSTTINLSNNTGSSVNPKISAAASSVSGSNSNNNNVYVVWVDETTGNNEILFKRIQIMELALVIHQLI